MRGAMRATARLLAHHTHTPKERAFYHHWHRLHTRWMDHDAFAHLNNAQYYSYIDTTVCSFLLTVAPEIRDAVDTAPRPFVVHSRCDFKKPIRFPDAVDGGMAVVKLGKSSCTYRVGLFREGDDDPAAIGLMVHVWIDPATEKPIAIPQGVREAYEQAH
eukprot:Sspe_Gene.94390::Locus_66783_Transcript_4_4_Confidence_0.727_Length_539::g.94390::m.94390/K07107/ybgC; acyl-CoA thioester hydrolase